MDFSSLLSSHVAGAPVGGAAKAKRSRKPKRKERVKLEEIM